MAEPCELVVMLSASTDEASRLADAFPDISFEPPSAPSHARSDEWYLTARIEDRSRAEELARRIAEMEGVQAAYVKPAGELPH